MRLLRRKREPEPSWYPGVRFRISTINGVVVDADSGTLYYMAKLGGFDEPCTPACLPDCEKHGWMGLIAGGPDGGLEFSQVPLKIEIRPVMVRSTPG